MIPDAPPLDARPTHATRPRRLGRAGLTCTALACLASALACGTLSPSSETDPCVQLGQVCDACKLPADLQNCNDAVSAADSAQCAAVLDQTGFQADCVGKDGGSSDAKSEDAAPLPACGAQASADAGCACTGSTCAPSCPGGGCSFTCTSGTCAPSCAGGHCHVVCEPGATCEGSCAGGDCVLDCKGGSQCASTCAGGGCTFQCEVNAICTDTCGSANTCIGM